MTAQQTSLAVPAENLTRFVGNDSQFGFSVGVSGDTAVLGGPFNGDGDAQPFVLVDLSNTPLDPSDDIWIPQGPGLTGSMLSGSDDFGVAVAIDDDRIVVGAPESSPGGIVEAGAAYVFDRAGGAWSETGYLIANSGASTSDKFGSAVALQDYRVIVGAPLDDVNGGNSGSIYVFSFQDSTWHPTQVIQAPVQTEDFGRSIDIDGDVLIVGAPTSFGSFNNQGLAFIYRLNDAGTPDLLDDVWEWETTLSAPTPDNNEIFGRSVGVSGPRAIVGANGDNLAAQDAGAVYVFEELFPATWISTAALTASNATNADGFGYSSAIDGDRIVVGAPFDGLSHFSAGTAYLFEFRAGAWFEEDNFYSFKNADGYRFGYSSDLDGERMIVGVPQFDAAGNRQGAALVLDATRGGFGLYGFGDGTAGLDCLCTNSTVGHRRGCVNSQGYGAQLEPIGSDSFVANDLNLAGSGFPGTVSALAFVSTTQALPAIPLGNGLLVVGQLGRLTAKPTSPTGFVRWGAPLDPPGAPQFWGPGDTVFFQAWYRDTEANCMKAFNTTNGVLVSFQP